MLVRSVSWTRSYLGPWQHVHLWTNKLTRISRCWPVTAPMFTDRSTCSHGEISKSRVSLCLGHWANQLKTWAQNRAHTMCIVTTTLLCYLISVCGVKLGGCIMLSPLHSGTRAGELSFGAKSCKHGRNRVWLPKSDRHGSGELSCHICWAIEPAGGYKLVSKNWNRLVHAYQNFDTCLPRLTIIANWYALSSTVFGESYNWACF